MSVKQLLFKKQKNQEKTVQLPKPSFEQEKSSRKKLSTFQEKFCAICFEEDDRNIGDEQVKWIQCAKCAVWVHSQCLHLQQEDNEETYPCICCVE